MVRHPIYTGILLGMLWLSDSAGLDALLCGRTALRAFVLAEEPD